MADATKRVLVCGATGDLGGYVIEAAKAHGHWVRALVRDASRLGARCEPCDDVFVGQATQPETPSRASARPSICSCVMTC